DVLRPQGLDPVRVRGAGRADVLPWRLRAAAGCDRAQRAGVLGRRRDPRDLLAGRARDAGGRADAGGGRPAVAAEPPRGGGPFPPEAFEREDESADAGFYGVPRKVVHIDDGAIAALGELYAEVLPTRGRLLDLMSSWRTHLPEVVGAREVVGL